MEVFEERTSMLHVLEFIMTDIMEEYGVDDDTNFDDV